MVVQYIFLYLLPTGGEAIVVAIVFVETFGAPQLAAVAIVGCTLYVVITIELTVWRMQFRKKMNKADNDASHKMTDSLLNIEIVKCFSAEKHELERYRESVEVFQDQAYRIQGSLSLLNSSQQLVLNATLVAALLVAAHEYAHGNFSLGQFVAINVYVIQLFAPLNFLGSIYGMAIGSYVDLENLCNIMAEAPDIRDRDGAHDLPIQLTTAPSIVSAPNSTAVAALPTPTTTPSMRALDIEFRNVTFAYPSRLQVPVLQNVSFKVPAGTTTALVGETGSGKSSLTKLLFRFYEVSAGQVLIAGHNVLDLKQHSLRRTLGMVPQDHSLFNDTLRYNIAYGRLAELAGNASDDIDDDAMDAAIQKAATAAELDTFVSQWPEGLETVVGERGQQLSGGQKQRIAIARVLLKDAPVVVLDEVGTIGTCCLYCEI
jgi:ABC-type transport system involved in Fe-S cluster assembly fused permease/ATPase subunit